MKLRHISLLLSLTVLSAAPYVWAQDQAVQPKPALALHGEVKYPANFDHFDYTNPAAPKGGTLKLGVIGTFDSLNPFIMKGIPAAGLAFLGQGLMYDSLMEQSNDEPFSMYGLLAETVEMPEDRSWVAFNLRPEAKWHDGQPITAKDVVWTFNTMLEKGTPFFKAYYADVVKVEATSAARVKFTFNHGGNAELPLIIAQIAVLPKHYWTDGKHDIGATTLEPPLGSGAYKIGNVKAGGSIEYERVKDWWGKDLAVSKGRFNFDKIVYDYYRDDNVALEAFFAGNFDVREENTAKLWATAYDAPPVKDGRIIKATIENQRPQGIQGFVYNTRRPVFQDRVVREALAYAFDFEWSNKQFAFGTYKRSRSYFSNSELAASGLPQGKELEILEKYRGKIPDEVFTTEYNPPKTDGSGNIRGNLRKASQLLDSAGWKLGADGIRQKDGKRLSFEILDDNPQFERWTLPFIANLKKIGVEAKFRVVDPAQYQKRSDDFDFDMTVGGFAQSNSPGNEQRDFWSSEKADVKGSRNAIGLKDPVIDELVNTIIAAGSREELVAATHALDRVLQWGYYVVPQWHLNTWRLAWWQKLDHPEKLSPLTPGITDTWWSVD